MWRRETANNARGLEVGLLSFIVSITWWTWENVLEQALFIGPPGEPARLKDVTGQGLLACVWELQIHHFESLAWLRTVLSNPQGPDLDAYLSQRFRAVV